MRATAGEAVVRETEKDSKILHNTDFYSFVGMHMCPLRQGPECSSPQRTKNQ